MKTIKIIIILFITVVTLNSCEKEYVVSKVFKEKFTEQPISSLIVGIYKFEDWVGPEKSLDSVKLIGTAKTDSNGRVTFILDDQNVRNYIFLPIRTTDTTSVNAKYYFNNVRNIPSASFEPNDIVYLQSYYYLYFIVKTKPNTGSLTLKIDDSYYSPGVRNDTLFYSFSIKPGKTYNFEFFKKNFNEYVYFASKSIYVKYFINSSKQLYSDETINQTILTDISF